MRKKITLIFVLSSLTIFIISCNNDKDNTKEISKEGSVESVITVNHLSDSLDLVETTYKIWSKNVMVNTFVHTDTIPSLGTTTDRDDDGNPTGMPYPKDYEVFITVK